MPALPSKDSILYDGHYYPHVFYYKIYRLSFFNSVNKEKNPIFEEFFSQEGDVQFVKKTKLNSNGLLDI
jgi:hypothetical protein